MLLGARDDNPAAALQLPRRARTLPRTLSPAEAERLIDAAAGTTPRAMRDRALVELMYGAGLRVSEATGLHRRSVDLDDRIVRALGKGSKERIVPLGRPAVEALRRYIAMGRPHLDRRTRPELFLNARGGPLTRAGAFLILRRLAEKAGPRAAARAPAPAPPLVRHPPARRRRRPPQRPGDARPRRPLHHRAVHARIRSAASRVVFSARTHTRDEERLRKGSRMTLDPQIAVLAALTMAIGYTMFFTGLKKHALELKRRKRVCPVLRPHHRRPRLPQALTGH